MFSRPIWLVGFRPFFTLAFVSGALLPLIWALVFSGTIHLPDGLDPIRWHGHEMFYGFGWAVLGGFLLTASKNWVGIRGMHGGPLALAVLFWLIERVAILTIGSGPGPLALVLLNAFGLYVIGYLVWTLVRYRKQDTFPDNWYFVFGLPFFLAAKNAMLLPTTWTIGVGMTIGLFRLAFAVMFERTMTQFMKNAMGVIVPRRRWLDRSIKATVFAAIFEPLLPPSLAAAVLALAALLLFGRWLTWKPLVGLRTFGIGIMFVGYLGLVIHLVLAALRDSGLFLGIGTLATHAFTLLCMGLIIPAMLIRICQGHTGRKLLFTRSDRIAIGFMGLAAFSRLVMTQLMPSQYVAWIAVAAVGWSVCFVVIGMRLVPFLFQPRVDQREH